MPRTRPRYKRDRRRWPERAAWLAAAVAALGVVAGVLVLVPGGSPPTGTKAVGAPRAAPQPTRPPTQEAGVPAPLTGVLTTADLARPAVGIKISNTPDAHPHRGLAEADLVFVEPITVDTTRLLAIFHSKLPSEAGPVRSLRPMDAPLVGPTGGVLAHTMAQPWVLELVGATADVASLGTMQVPKGTYRIDGSRVEPNHVFAQPHALLELTDRTDPPAPYFSYSDEATAQLAGAPAASVTIGYGGPSTATWTYDRPTRRWLRSEEWSEHVLETGERVAADNVVVLRAARDWSLPQAGADMTVLDLVHATGTLELFTGGAVAAGRWSKGEVNEPFQFTTENGEPLLLTPGTTWVELAVDTMTVTVSP